MKKRILSFVLLCLLILSILPSSAEDVFGNEYRVVKCNEYITLRETASTKAAALDRVPLGATVTALSEAINGFMLVNYNGKMGYVLERYLEQMPVISGTPIALTPAQHANMNLFLSNFTESCLSYVTEGVFDVQSTPDKMLVEFAVDHLWFNSHETKIEWGEYFNGNNVRVHRKYVPEILDQYFGKAVTDYAPYYVDFVEPYYYWQETGGHTSGGFACTDQVQYLGGDRYFVSFVILASGEMWETEDTQLTLPEARAKFPGYSRRAYAIVYTPNLNDHTTFRLTRYVTE